MSKLRKLTPPPYDSLQPGHYEAQDFGPTEFVADGPPIEVKMRRLTGTELTAAGVDTAKKLYRCWTDDEVTFSEAQTLRHDTEGDLNATSIIPYPERGITIIEAEKVG